MGGYSPHLHLLPKELLATGPVIGINLWGRDFPCDYWIALDTFKYPEWGGWLKELEAVKFMRQPKSPQEQDLNIPLEAVDYWFTQATGFVPLGWEEKLAWISSTALAAINLAIILGGKEVVLYGVDFVGSGRADGSEYPKPDFWGPHKEGINNMIREFSRHIKIYKLNPASWLDCELMEVA